MNFVTRCALTVGYAWSAVALGASAADAMADVSKVNGSITLGAGAQAGDDVGALSGTIMPLPRVRVVTEGPLHFEREVDLYVAPGVTLPQVRGVPPNRHALQ